MAAGVEPVILVASGAGDAADNRIRFQDGDRVALLREQVSCSQAGPPATADYDAIARAEIPYAPPSRAS